MWEGAPRWCRRRSDGRSCAGIGTAAFPGVTDHMRGVTLITLCTGRREVEPGSRTWCCCVVDITAWSTQEMGSPSSSRETDRCSDDPTDRCSRIALHRSLLDPSRSRRGMRRFQQHGRWSRNRAKVQEGARTSSPSLAAAAASFASYVTRAAMSDARDSAVARWIASSVRSEVGSSRAARIKIASSIGISAIRSMTSFARPSRSSDAPIRRTARSTSTRKGAGDDLRIRAKRLDQCGGLRLGCDELHDGRGVEI